MEIAFYSTTLQNSLKMRYSIIAGNPDCLLDSPSRSSLFYCFAGLPSSLGSAGETPNAYTFIILFLLHTHMRGTKVVCIFLQKVVSYSVHLAPCFWEHSLRSFRFNTNRELLVALWWRNSEWIMINCIRCLLMGIKLSVFRNSNNAVSLCLYITSLCK